VRQSQRASVAVQVSTTGGTTGTQIQAVQVAADQRGTTGLRQMAQSSTIYWLAGHGGGTATNHLAMLAAAVVRCWRRRTMLGTTAWWGGVDSVSAFIGGSLSFKAVAVAVVAVRSVLAVRLLAVQAVDNATAGSRHQQTQLGGGGAGPCSMHTPAVAQAAQASSM
jgi:hypothetical protein